MAELPRYLCNARQLSLIVALLFFVVLSLRGESQLLNDFSLGALEHRVTEDHSSITSPSQVVDSCSNYNGILHIQHGDDGAAGTTVFFCYVINYLLYAEEHNLIPWIHLDDWSERIYDPQVHGTGPPRSFPVSSHMKVTYDCGDDQICKPIPEGSNTTITVNGNGVWPTYFEPVSSFTLDKPCYLPYLAFTEDNTARMHYGWLKSVRAWHYLDTVRPKPKPGHMHEWYEDMRVRGARIVEKYYKPKPWLVEAIKKANPSKQCMSMHVRSTDKHGGRAIIGVDKYLPYAEAYAESVPSGSIYLASDSSKTLQEVTESWPQKVVDRIIMQPSVLQSSNETGVFDIGQHHRTNTDVLTDVYAMAACNVFLHGRSAVSESVIYTNLKLHNCSVDLEDPDQLTVEAFINMVGGDNRKCR